MRKQFNHIFKYTFAALVLTGASSCTDLDEELVDRYTQTFVPQNKPVGIRDNVNSLPPNDGLGAAFSQLYANSASNGGFFAVQEAGTDEAVITQKGGDWFDGGQYIVMHKHEFSIQTWGIADAWNNAANGILQCNTLLEGDIDAAKRAQLRTLRAYYHWRMMDVFGNVKIVTSTAGGPQKPRAEVYEFIVSELEDVIADLPSNRQEYARFNQSGAHALLSRIYLNSAIYTNGAKQEYQKAIDHADAVINSGIYDLQEVYSHAFGPKNSLPDSSVEHIFVIPFDESTAQGAIWPMMTLHYPSQLTYKLADQPWNGFSTLEDFYNSYEDGDDRKKSNFIVGPQYDPATGNQVLDLAFDSHDPDGAGVNYTPAINMLAPDASRQAGARFGKFRIKYGAFNDQDNDMPVLRYAEVLMNKAEAICRLNDNWNDGEALGLVNQIRLRAHAEPFGDLTEGKFLAERGREFFVEAHRRTDLIRFGAYGNAWWEKPVDANAEQHQIMAIPLSVIQAAADTSFPLTQNPGY